MTHIYAAVVCGAFAMSATAAVSAAASGDVARGAEAFRVCAACHSTQPGQHMTGPSLAGVWNRKAGTAGGFDRYSDALKHAQVVWNQQSLDAWLRDPARFIPGNQMTFPGVANAQTRRDLIAYLEAVSEGKAPASASKGGMMMMGSPRPADLKDAAPGSRVSSILYCRGTYTVVTASGEKRSFWEFNLRFKTDSSARGPAHGQPALVGAGMMGDRSQVVFAAPDEISTFIKTDCH
jgi:cytochrome c